MLVWRLVRADRLESEILSAQIHENIRYHHVIILRCKHPDGFFLEGLVICVLEELQLELERRWRRILVPDHYGVEAWVFLIVKSEVRVRVKLLARRTLFVRLSLVAPLMSVVPVPATEASLLVTVACAVSLGNSIAEFVRFVILLCFLIKSRVRILSVPRGLLA